MNLYEVESSTLGMKWIAQARDVEDAAGKVLQFNREWVSVLEKACARDGNDFNMDLKVTLLEGNVVKL